MGQEGQELCLVEALVEKADDFVVALDFVKNLLDDITRTSLIEILVSRKRDPLSSPDLLKLINAHLAESLHPLDYLLRVLDDIYRLDHSDDHLSAPLGYRTQLL